MASLQQQLAESGKQHVFDQLNRGQITEAQARSTLGGGGNSGGGQSVTDSFQEVMKLLQPSKDQAVSTLQSRTPEREAAFGGLTAAAEGQRPTIEQRYKDTLEDITKTTRGAAASEFTRRGIPLSSGLVEQTVGSRLGPQIGQAATQRDTNLLGIDQLLANIGFQKSQSGDALAQAIAAIQSSTGSEGITAAQNIFSQQESSRQAELNRALSQQQLDLTRQTAGQAESRQARLDPFEQANLEAQTRRLLQLASGGGGGGGDNNPGGI